MYVHIYNLEKIIIKYVKLSFLILFSKTLTEGSDLILELSLDHKWGPKYLRLFLPYFTVLKLFIEKSVFLRLYLWLGQVNKSMTVLS